MGVGSSAGPDGEKAGMRAARAALRDRGDSRLIVVFGNPRHDLTAVLRGITKVTGDVPLVGCSTSGEFTAAGPIFDGVVVAAFGGSGFQFETRAVEGISRCPREVGAEATESAATLAEGGHTAMLMLMDGRVERQEEVLRGAYDTLGASVPLIGGCAAPSPVNDTAFLLHEGRVLTDSLVTVAMRSEAPFGIGVAHGYEPVGDPILVTRSGPGRILELDDRPALDVYLDRLGASEEAYRDPQAFGLFALAHPVCVDRRSGREARLISGADFASRALTSPADIREGGTVWLSSSSTGTLLDAAGSARADAVRSLTGEPLGMLAFDGVGRLMMLGSESGPENEIRRLSGGNAEFPIAGCYSAGEIARSRGFNGFHNYAVAVLAVG
ncbi:FIST N-terminal domain-containing protein [Actinoplanes sp. NPDC049548]|uniref:FIST signal transduction protein n=1 Tax=Actinoplanes sp. NPDC049548 TaxID=3155152 RepID=UPI00341CBDB6